MGTIYVCKSSLLLRQNLFVLVKVSLWQHRPRPQRDVWWLLLRVPLREVEVRLRHVFIAYVYVCVRVCVCVCPWTYQTIQKNMKSILYMFDSRLAPEVRLHLSVGRICFLQAVSLTPIWTFSRWYLKQVKFCYYARVHVHVCVCACV